MSGLLDRIFPRRDASSPPTHGATPPSGFPAVDPAEQASALPPVAKGEAPPEGEPGAEHLPPPGGAPGAEHPLPPDAAPTSVLPVTPPAHGQPPPTSELPAPASDPSPTSGVGPATAPADVGAGTAPAGVPADPALASGSSPDPGSPHAAAPLASPAAVEIPDSPSMGQRAKLRRRLRYARKLRELLLRDLGGFVFDSRRFDRSREDLVAAKTDRLAAVDAEVRALERVLGDRRPLHELREPGVGGICDRCGAFFPSTARFCSDCGASVEARAPLTDETALKAATPAPTGSAPPPPAEGLWSAGPRPHQAGPDASEGTPPRQPDQQAGAAHVAGNGAEAARPDGEPLPGGLQRPDDDGAPPSLSSGDPLQQR